MAFLDGFGWMAVPTTGPQMPGYVCLASEVVLLIAGLVGFLHVTHAVKRLMFAHSMAHGDPTGSSQELSALCLSCTWMPCLLLSGLCSSMILLW